MTPELLLSLQHAPAGTLFPASALPFNTEMPYWVLPVWPEGYLSPQECDCLTIERITFERIPMRTQEDLVEYYWEKE